MKIHKGRDGSLWVFSESANGWIRPEENDGDFDLGEFFSELIRIKMTEKKDLSYGAAFAEVQKENPKIAKQYLEQIRPKSR